MNKRLLLWAGVGLTVLLMAGLIGATVVSAQEPTPEPQAHFGLLGGGHGRGGFGRGMFGEAGGGQWTMFDTAAETLGLTPDELFTELHAGKSMDEIAAEQGVELEALQDAMSATRAEAMQQGIEQAVEDGRMSQEQADWMLKGLDQGFLPGGPGFRGQGLGRGWGRCDCSQGD